MIHHRKNIFIISNTDGAQYKFRGSLIKTLRYFGWNVTSICSVNSPEGSYRASVEEISDQSIFCPFARSGLLGYIQTILMLRAALKERPDAIVHTFGHEATVLTFMALAFRLKKQKFFITFTGLGRLYDQEAGLYYKSIRFFLSVIYKFMSKRISSVFLNKEDMELLIRECHLDPSRCLMTYGEGYERPSTAPQSIKLKEEDRECLRLLYAGRLMKEKGLPELLASIELVKRPVQLVIAGTYLADENDRLILDAVAGRMPNVIFKGYVADLDVLFQDIHAVVLPTMYREGLPRILIEALAYGKFIITTSAPGANSTVVAGLNGTLLSSVNPQSIADAINAISTNDLVAAFDHSRMMFDERFEASTINREIIKFYDAE